MDDSVQVFGKLRVIDQSSGSLELFPAAATEGIKVKSLCPFVLLGLKKNGRFSYCSLLCREDGPLVDTLVERVHQLSVVSTCEEEVSALSVVIVLQIFVC